MADYFEKPRTVRAVQYTGANADEVIAFGEGAVLRPDLAQSSGPLVVLLWDFRLTNVSPGDYVLRDGSRFAAMKQHEFEERYAPVPAGP